MDCVNAEGPRGDDIRLDIVNINSVLGINRKTVDQQFENSWVGLYHSDLARDHNAAKPTQKLEAL